MKKKNIIILICSIVILAVGSILGLYYYHKKSPIKVDKDFSKIDLSNVTKVMFVAHPDDDSIWGGAHLLNEGDKYLVVCITCGVRQDRVLEFQEAMKQTNSEYIMLGWPDKTNGEKDNWDTSKDGIKEDIDKILNLKEWDLIVTHNPDGEYGHIHHKMTNQIVTNLADKDKLMYFGKYYKASIIDNYKDNMKELDDNIYKEKYDLIGVYKTQDFVYDMFGHMFKYENWLSYEDWYNEE